LSNPRDLKRGLEDALNGAKDIARTTFQFFSELLFSITPGWEAIRKVGVEYAVVKGDKDFFRSIVSNFVEHANRPA